MDDDLYDEFGHYIGPALDEDDEYDYEDEYDDQMAPQEDVDDATEQTMTAGASTTQLQQFDPNQVHKLIDAGGSFPTAEELYGNQVEVLVQLEDTHTLAQPIIAPTDVTDGYKSAIDTGYSGALHPNFMLPEKEPPRVTYNPTPTISSILPHSWLHRNIAVVGATLHGKTALIDLFYSQSHLDLLEATICTDKNFKLGTDNKATKKVNLASETTNLTDIGLTWPALYSDAFQRERKTGFTTKSKPNSLILQCSPHISSASSQPPHQLRQYLFNLIDTPGHDQYQHEFISHLRLADNALLCVDVIEGCVSETEYIIEQCIKFQIPMVLVLTKMDRLILESNIPPSDALARLSQLIEQINAYCMQIYELYYHHTTSSPIDYNCPSFSPVENNVLFTSTLHTYVFTLSTFAYQYLYQQQLQQFQGALTARRAIVQQQSEAKSGGEVPKLREIKPISSNDVIRVSSLLWGNCMFNASTGEFFLPSKAAAARSEARVGKSFLMLVLEPIYKAYSACLTGNIELIRHVYNRLHIVPDEEALRRGGDELLRDIMGKWFALPLHSMDEFRAQCARAQRSVKISSLKAFSSPQHPSAFYTAAIIGGAITHTTRPPNVNKHVKRLLHLQPSPQVGGFTGGSMGDAHSHPLTGSASPNVALDSIRLTYMCDIVSLIPHPNAQTFDLLCRVYALPLTYGDSSTSSPSLAGQIDPQLLTQALKQPALSKGDSISLYRSSDQSYLHNHVITHIYTQNSYRYRVDVNHCYDGNIVVLSFDTEQDQSTGSVLSSTISNFIAGQGSAFNQRYYQLSTQSAHKWTSSQIEHLPVFQRHTPPQGLHFNISMEPKIPSELPMLLENLNRVTKVFADGVIIGRENTGSHVITCASEVIADDILDYIRSFPSHIALAISNPFISFREGVSVESPLETITTSTNGANQVSVISVPQNHEQVSEMVNIQQQQSAIPHRSIICDKQHPVFQNISERNQLSIQQHQHFQLWGSKNTYLNEILSKYSVDDLAYDTIPWSFGLNLDANTTLLDDCVRTSRYDDDNTHTDQDLDGEDYIPVGEWEFDHIASIVEGFDWVASQGPLTESPLHNTRINLTSVNINRDVLKSSRRFLIPCTRRVMHGSILLSSPKLYEPVIWGEVITTLENFDKVTKVLSRRRGHCVTQIPISGTKYSRMPYTLPTIESIGFHTDIKLATKGISRISGNHSNWQLMDGDPLDIDIPLSVLKVSPLPHLPRELLLKTRRRKGLPEIVLTDYYDQEMIERMQQAEEEYQNQDD